VPTHEEFDRNPGLSRAGQREKRLAILPPGDAGDKKERGPEWNLGPYRKGDRARHKRGYDDTRLYGKTNERK